MAGTRTNRAEFLRILNLVEPGLSPRPFLEQSQCYILKSGFVSTFNDEICCRAKSGLPRDVTGAVQAKPLKDVLGNMSDDDVTITVRAKELHVAGHRKEAGIRLEREIVLPLDDVTMPESWQPLPADFAAAVAKVANAAGSNDEEFITICVHIAPGYMEATDRRQGCRYDLTTGVDESFLVRAKSLIHLAGLDMLQVGTTKEWVHFGNKTMGFACRRHIVDYPDLATYFDFEGEPATLPRGGPEAAKLAGTFCEGKENDKVTVSLTDGNMLVRGEGSFGWASAELKMEYAGPDVTFRLTPSMLAQLIKDNDKCELSGRKLKVTGEHWTYVSALGRPKADEPVTVAAEEDADGEDDD